MTRVHVVGAAGYAASELIRLLAVIRTSNSARSKARRTPASRWPRIFRSCGI